MFKYVCKRLLQSMVTLVIVATTVFLLLRLMPEEGYFAEGYDKMDEAQIEAALTDMGLRDPLPIQLKNFFVGLLHGDLGKSIVFRPKVPITKIIGPKIPYSLYFGLASIVISLGLGIPLGMLMARFKGKAVDNLGSAYVVAIKAVPAAVYFLFLQLYVSSALGVPMLFDERKPVSWILPAICMSLGGIANYAMWIRRYMVDELNKDYIKLARAKGVSESNIALHHVFRNAMVPLVQYIPSAFLNTVVGSIYIESLYSIPGMGGLLVTCVQRHDNTMVQGIVLLYACVGIIGLILGDVLMVLLDPRIHFGRKEGGR